MKVGELNNLLNTREVAEILGITELETIYRFISEGKLKATKLGGNGKSKRHWRIKQEDLEAFVDGNTGTESGHTEADIKTESGMV